MRAVFGVFSVSFLILTNMVFLCGIEPVWFYIKRMFYYGRKTLWFFLIVVERRSIAVIRELKQPRPRRQQERLKFAYLTMKNNSFARFARAFFIFGHLADVLDLSTTWNDLFCSCVDDVSIWWQIFNFVSLPLKRWFQINSRIVWTHFASVMTFNNSEMIAEMRSYIFIWRSCHRRRRVCLNSLLLQLSPRAKPLLFTAACRRDVWVNTVENDP